jgi:tetratricopeptide (TPR) repeat protein
LSVGMRITNLSLTEIHPSPFSLVNSGADALGELHPVTADILDNLGCLYLRLGRLEAAQEYHQRAFTIRTLILDENHLSIATSSTSLSEFYKEIGKYDLALPLCVKSLRIRQIKLRENHPLTLGSLNNLADVFFRLERYKAAICLHKLVLKRRRIHLGCEHEEVAESLNNIGCVNLNLGEYKEAIFRLEEALKIYKKRLGDYHRNTVNTKNNLAIAFSHDSQIELALELQTQVVEFHTKCIGGNNIDAARGMVNLAAISYELQNYTQCELLTLQAINILRQHVDASHPELKMIFNSLFYFVGEMLKSGKEGCLSSHPMTQDILRNHRKRMRVFPKGKPQGFGKQALKHPPAADFTTTEPRSST